MTTPTSENQWLSIISNNQASEAEGLTSNISYDEDGLIDSTSFELNWIVADEQIIDGAGEIFSNGFNGLSDASGDFEGCATIYSETVLNEDGTGYYYLYESLNTTDVSDPRYILESEDASVGATYSVRYSNKEKEALKERFTLEYDSFSEQLTAIFEGAVASAVSASFRASNRYVFRKVKEPILGTKNLSALKPITETEVTSVTATTIATTTGTTTSY